MKAVLHLQDGSSFEGELFGAATSTCGEVGKLLRSLLNSRALKLFFVKVLCDILTGNRKLDSDPTSPVFIVLCSSIAYSSINFRNELNFI